ncbi:putative RNA-binding protein [Cladorrhinum sp. PSN332]|nr:putative RNA-binding protein [Cladorrhinum sp. PSN332]
MHRGGRYSSRDRDRGGGGGGYRDRSRDHDYDGGGYERDRDHRFDQRNDDYRRSRKDSPPAPLRNLNYDDDTNEDRHDGPARGAFSSSRHAGHHSGFGRDGHPQDARVRPGSRWGDDGLDREARPLGNSDRDGRPFRYDRDSSPPSRRRAGDLAPGGHAGRPDLPQHRGSVRPELGAGRRLSHGREGVGSEHHRSHQQAPRGSGKTVILSGLPEDVTERDILFGLDYATRDRHFSNDQVKIVRIQTDQTGQPIASVEFNRRSDADYFLEQFFPDISFPLQQSRGADSESVTVRVESANMHYEPSYSHESYRDDQDGWECTNCGGLNYPHRAVCFKCKEDRTHDDYRVPSGPVLTGETDECPQQLPSQYVVIRGLDRPVSAEVLAKGVMKLFVENLPTPKEPTTTSTNKLKSTAPTNSTVGLGAKPGSLRRVFLMRDRKTNESWRYGFAEFATVEDAIAAVAKFRASPKFTISSKLVFVAFIHTGVFVPAAPNEHPDFCFTPIYNSALRLKYWDDRAYPNIHVVTTDPVLGAPSTEKGGNNDPNKSEAKSFKKWAKKDKEISGAVPKISMMPQMQMWAKASAQLHGGQPKQNAQDPATQGDSSAFLTALTLHQPEDTQPDGPYGPNPTDQYLSYADWDSMSCVVCNWKASTDQRIKERGLPYTRSDLLIFHEGKAHQFYRDPQVKEKAAAALAALRKQPRTIIRRAPRLKSDALPIYKSYADFDRLYCVLCKRKFERVETVWLHEQQSELHKRMLADPDNRARAEEVLKKLCKKQHSCVPTSAFYQDWEAQLKHSQGAGYRDRALERRQAFNQPKKPSGQPVAAKSSSAAVGEKRKEPSSTTETDDKEPAAKKNKGMNMLAKMGWTAGAGLGADGAGRTEAIAAEVYAPGVGLGVEGGKLGDAHEEASRKTKGDQSSFVEKTKDRARERFERMS